MKAILSSQTMDIPDGVTVKVKAKMVEVDGPRGKLTRNFKHLNLDFDLIEGGKKLKVDAWFSSRKATASIRTALSHIQNLITGVTKGYRYKMRFVYAHFPINASITNSNTSIEIRNFLGEKKIARLRLARLAVFLFSLLMSVKLPSRHREPPVIRCSKRSRKVVDGLIMKWMEFIRSFLFRTDFYIYCHYFYSYYFILDT